MDTAILHGGPRMQNCEVFAHCLRSSVHYAVGLLWFFSGRKSRFDKVGIKAMVTVFATLWEKALAVVSFLGNADGVDGATHARVGVAA